MQESTQLSGKQVRAAFLVAEDELTNEQIAAHVGVARPTLDRWKKLPEFQARVSEHIQVLGQSLERYAIARKDLRIRRYNERWQHIERIREARSHRLAGIAGAETGWIIEHPTEGGPEFVVDTALMAEERNLAKQAAQEMGQWTEKRQTDVSGSLALDVTATVRDLLAAPIEVTYADPDTGGSA